ncbi:MAG: hypothetical protein ACU0DP_20085 [Thalassococcus profundi]|uniref:hypothetical protein n=1 Tax=Thalassococcus profundi TaxID=2282382 RepID=UPI004058A14D
MIRRDRRQTCLPRYRSRPADTAEAFARDTVERLLAAMTRHGSFADAVQGAPGFDSNVLPDGIRLVSHRAQMTGAVLARDTAGLSFAGLTAERLAHDVMDPVLRDLFGEAAHWRGMGALLTGMLETPRLLLRFECETALVDPLFGGDALRGGALILQTVPQHAPLH